MNKLYEKQNVYRLRRGEQKFLQASLEKERVDKFVALIEKKEDKYQPLALVARAILSLISEDPGVDS